MTTPSGRGAPAHVLIADTEPVYAVGAEHVLRGAGYEVTLTDAWAAGLVARVLAIGADVVLLDARLGSRPYAADTVAALLAEVPGVCVVVSVGSGRPVGLLQAMESGVRALVHRRSTPDELCAAVDAALRGQNWVAAPLAGLLRAELIADAAGQREAELTRERDVLRGMATGATNASIAAGLGISEHTVRNHAHSLMRKLGVANRTDAVATAARRGLVDLAS